ncbi:uncharacterized protein [Euphorbia lathyris]|uniref:uncharacterized protein n=1 Tax=Euphorbia lathyris TaxID=212925 RepID=UPI003313BF9B
MARRGGIGKGYMGITDKEGADPRRTSSRPVTASARRDREEQQRFMADARRAHAAQAERAKGRDEAAGIDMDGDASMHRPSADTIPIDRGVVTRGRDGRFSSTAASSSGSSKRSRSVEDDWVVKDPVPGVSI